jgi:hypothetical protein
MEAKAVVKPLRQDMPRSFKNARLEDLFSAALHRISSPTQGKLNRDKSICNF